MKILHLNQRTACIPKGFILLEDQCDAPNVSKYLYVVEILNGNMYGLPHFYFYRSEIISDIDMDQIYTSCSDACPYFDDSMHISSSIKASSEYLTDSELPEPKIGVFKVVSTEDDYFDPYHHCQKELMLIRQNNISSDNSARCRSNSKATALGKMILSVCFVQIFLTILLVCMISILMMCK